MTLPMLAPSDDAYISEVMEELRDTANKRQIFRSETQMRYSVLQDGVHPNNASKYWQCVTEQWVMYQELVSLSFSYRELVIKIKKEERKLADTEDELDRELSEIALDKLAWSKAEAERVGADRVREIKQWSALKKEFDDGTFDTASPYFEQDEILRMRLENRKASLTPGSSQAEVLNVLGPLATFDNTPQLE